MRHVISLLLFLPTFAPAERESHPGYAPTFLRATASHANGKVTVQLSRAGPAVPPLDGEQNSGRLPLEWADLRPVVLGESVQAFGVDGKPLGDKAVLKALAEPRCVVVFIRTYENDPLTPAGFYRTVLREGSVILVLKGEDLYNARP